MKKIILASASPRRKELLSKMGIDYEVVVSDIDEGKIKGMLPEQLVQVLASQKAKAVAEDIGKANRLIIGADTIVVLNNKVLGKPANSLEATKMLKSLSGQKHQVYTGVAIVDTDTGKEELFVEKTNVYMKHINDQEIQTYVATKEPLDKAGSYGIQGKGGVFIEKIEGDYFTVMGLPISQLYDHLKKFK